MTSTSLQSELAPIIVFAYNRPNHLKKTIEALKLNTLASSSMLIIYSDGQKNDLDTGVREVRKYITTIKGFKSIKVTYRDTNNGLAKQIISGVTEVINKYGTAIIIEDDIVTSQSFLLYINSALKYYASKKNIWHISGWNYPVVLTEDDEVILWRVMHCWGWATWKDRWNNFEKNPDNIIESFTEKDIYRFNLDNAEKNFWEQVLLNKKKILDTWAIFWYATIFKSNGLCVNPPVMLCRNIGFDNLGTNCRQRNDLFDLEGPLKRTYAFSPSSIETENSTAIDQVKKFYKFNLMIQTPDQKYTLTEDLKEYPSIYAAYINELEDTKLKLAATTEQLKVSTLLYERTSIELQIVTNNISRIQNTKIWKFAEKARFLLKIVKPDKVVEDIIQNKVKLSINHISKKLVYVGHSYHEKTKSTRFLIDYLKKHFDVEVMLDESWMGKPSPKLDFVDESYLGVVFFQNLPTPEIVNDIQNANIIFFPMYDGSWSRSKEYWEQYKNIKYINFSRTLHEKMTRFGLESLYIQYFPKPGKLTLGKLNSIFFWQRLTHININTLEMLLPQNIKYSVHLHHDIDPEQQYLEPSSGQKNKFNFTFSKWFKNRSGMLKKVADASIYVAPREYEGIGLSYLEAMAMGKAVIAVNNPTMNEYIEDNKTGYLFDLNNPKKIKLDNLRSVQKNCYKYIKAGYKEWEKDKKIIIDFIKK